YAIGDSKANEIAVEAPSTMPAENRANVYAYARAGEGYDYMVANIADLQAQKVDYSLASEVQRDVWADMDEFPKVPLRPDSLMFSNFGVNDIDGSTYTGAQEVANFKSLAATLGYDDVIFTDINPWGAVATAGEITETKSFNALALDECRASGWVFVPLYYDTSDQPTNPDDLLPAFTSDGLHPNLAGSLLISGLMDCAIQEWRQRGTS
ncbi:MAG: SGNH/GDSL hydrolase family protein, partial [Chloroflexi bacterium]|nr:SGNH/GDSL hydrolase family protein [Chloroflexota bacterium]